MKRFLRATLWGALPGIIFLAALPVSSQTAGSSLRGTVRTEDGAIASGAIVQARSEQSGAVRVTTTDADGRYQFPALSTGDWLVVARLTDGRVSESVVIRLKLQDSLTQDLTVGGGVTERIKVTAETQLIDRKETSGVLRVSGDQVADLPIAGRSFTDLALLDSSVRPAAEGSYFGESGAVFVVNGASGRSNSFLVDGLDNNDQVSGTSLGSFYSQQVIAEFVLQTHQFSPEFGRAAGGVMNIVTKQGGNERGVEAFIEGVFGGWGQSGDFIDSLPAVGSDEDRSSRIAGGFNVSGPFKKDKAFYFLAYEHNSEDSLIGYTGVDENEIPGGRFLAPKESDNFFLRTDFNLGTDHQLMLRLAFDDRETSGVNVGGLYTPDAGFNVAESDLSLAGALTSVVSPSFVNEFRFLVSDSSFDQYANSNLSGVNRPGGIFGGNPLNKQIRDEFKYQLVNDVTWSQGNHTLKFGLNVTRSRIDLDAAFNPNGGFGYDNDIPFNPGSFDTNDNPFLPGNCNISITDVRRSRDNGSYPFVYSTDPGCPDPADIRSYPLVFSYVFGQPSNRFDDTSYGLYIQDHWQPRPNWFFEYGLRYDLSTYELPQSARVDSTIPNGGADRDTDNLAPRFGFTWTPSADSRFVVRGGGGLFYDKLVLAFPAVSAVTSGTEIGLFFPRGLAIELTEDVIAGQGVESVVPALFFFDELVLSFSTATELETPYSVLFNIGADIPTGPRSAFRVNATSSRGHHLPLLLDLNPVIGLYDPGPGSCPNGLDDTLEEGIPCHGNDPSTGSIAAISTEGRSWYGGLDLGWRFQGNQGWLDTSYTYSRAEDTGFDPLKGGISIPQDSVNFLQTERGRADGDRRHRFVFAGETGIGAGFRLSGVISLSSGLAFNVTSGTDINTDGILTDRPEGVRRNAGEDTDLAAINAFRLDPTRNENENTNTVPVTGLDEPTFAQVDLKLSKVFQLNKGRGRAEAYVQVFNVFDRVNYGQVDGRIVSENFGRGITLAGPPRTVLSGFKIGF